MYTCIYTLSLYIYIYIYIHTLYNILVGGLGVVLAVLMELFWVRGQGGLETVAYERQEGLHVE